jgi:hypothetical protein
MRKCSTISATLLAAVFAGCVQTPARQEASDHYYRLVSFPTVALKADPLERIDSVEVVMHCGRFVAINRIPSDWSAQVVSPVSEETRLRLEAGHGSSSLCHSADLDGFITVLVCEPSCFDITVSLSVFSYDSELHERKISFKQSDLVMVPLPNQTVQQTGASRLAQSEMQTSSAAGSRR